LPSLNPNTRYFFRARAVTDGGQDTTEIADFRTPSTSATARLTVKKTNADGTQTLKGACWDLWTNAGNGTLGDFVAGYCDRYDATPNNGRTVFPALQAGSYVLVETLSPTGYVIGKPRTVSLSQGQARTLTVKDTAGGTRLKVLKQDQAGQPVAGACFVVFANVGGDVGNYVSANCDDYDASDGATALGSLPPGAYFLWESYVPTGYVRAPLTPFAVSASQTKKTITVRDTPVDDANNVVVRAVDANSMPVPGACFTVFDAGGSFVAAACDSADGRTDGVTYFRDVAPGDYTLVERWAPAGYVVGARTTFTKVADTIGDLEVTQTPGGQKATVKTVDATTS